MALRSSKRHTASKTQDVSHLKHEYERSIDIFKQYSTLQFAQLSIFTAVNGAAFVFFFGEKPPQVPPEFVVAARSGLAFVALLFWVMQESHTLLVAHFLRRCAHLERKLGYIGFVAMPGMPHYRYGPAKWALRLFYLLVLLTWLSLAVWGRANPSLHSTAYSGLSPASVRG